MVIVDGHLDLSINALEWNRDLLASVYCRVLVPHQRRFSDAQSRAVVERGGVIVYDEGPQGPREGRDRDAPT